MNIQPRTGETFMEATLRAVEEGVLARAGEKRAREAAAGENIFSDCWRSGKSMFTAGRMWFRVGEQIQRAKAAQHDRQTGAFTTEQAARVVNEAIAEAMKFMAIALQDGPIHSDEVCAINPDGSPGVVSFKLGQAASSDREMTYEDHVRRGKVMAALDDIIDQERRDALRDAEVAA